MEWNGFLEWNMEWRLKVMLFMSGSQIRYLGMKGLTLMIRHVYFCNRLNNISWVTAVTPTDRPKSVRNSCVIKVLVAFLCCHVAFLDCSVGEGVFVTELNQISSFFSFEDKRKYKRSNMEHWQNSVNLLQMTQNSRNNAKLNHNSKL